MKTRELMPYLNKLHIERIAYIDKLFIWIDTLTDIVSERTHDEMNAGKSKYTTVIKDISMYDKTWKQKIQLFQPTEKVLESLFADICAAKCGHFISSVELTIDFITSTVEEAHEMHALLQERFIHRAGKKYHYEEVKRLNKYGRYDPSRLGTTYFALTKVHKIIPTMYADKESKIAKKPCFHMEYKLSSAKRCRRKNFLVLPDLIGNIVVDFFAKNVSFYKKPAKCVVGKAVAEKIGSKAESRRQYEKLCNSYLKTTSKAAYAGQEHNPFKNGKAYEFMCLQELLQFVPNLSKYMDTKNHEIRDIIVRALFS